MDMDTFLAERRTGIGGSDVHHVFSLEPYGCARLLWYKKRGTTPDYPQDETGPMRRGTLLEPIIASEYSRLTSRTLTHQDKALRHPVHQELLVHLDSTIEPSAATEPHPGPGVLEIKTVGREYFYKLKRDGLPEGYILQIQHAMLVAGYQWGAFAVLWPDQWKLLYWDVDRDGEMIELIKNEALKFWALVENGPIPEPLKPTDRRCAACSYRTSCQGAALLESAHEDDGSDVPYDGSLAALTQEYVELRGIRDEAEAQLEEVKTRLGAAIDKRTAVDTAGARIYYRPQTAMRWDTKSLEKAHPELVKDYKKPSISRPLRIFPR